MSAEALETGFAHERDTGVFARAGVLRRLARDRVAALAGLVLTVVVLAALLAPWIAPYDPYFTDLTKVMRPPTRNIGSAPTIPAATFSAASSTARATR